MPPMIAKKNTFQMLRWMSSLSFESTIDQRCKSRVLIGYLWCRHCSKLLNKGDRQWPWQFRFYSVFSWMYVENMIGIANPSINRKNSLFKFPF